MQDSAKQRFIYSFPPILPDNPRILILGTMPGRDSLKYKQYYGFKYNHFWPMIYQILGNSQDPWEQTYEERINQLLMNNIALWDVYKSCTREKGSLDQSISDTEFNELGELLQKNNDIKAVFCNGSRAAKGFKEYNTSGMVSKERLEELAIHKLPSSSPIPTRQCRIIEEKFEFWKLISRYLK